MSLLDRRRLPVWAPAAGRVDAVLDGRELALVAQGDGWWAAGEDVPPGTDYRFRLDGGEPLPDPRSMWQPEGVHGPSRTVDPAEFEWSDAGWQPAPLSAAVIYELHVGTFSREGTFEGAIAHLDHLVSLGVTHAELLPVAEFPGDRGWGYDGVDLYAPHHAYGGPAGLVRLVDACHARGLGVLLDVVYNHLGPAGNYLGRFGPYFTDRYSTPWGDAVNLDGRGSEEVRRFVVDNALMWLRDYHFDGLRIDAVHAIVDTSAVHLLEQMAEEVDVLEATTGRHKILIAESDLNDPRVVRPPALGGHGIDAQWSDDFHHALHSVLTGERDGYYADFGRLDDLAQTLRHAFRYRGGRSGFRGRRHGRPIGALSAHHFLGYLQNHDQVGNRAQGERSAALMSHGRLKVGAAVVLLSPFVPMLFAGEEWAASSPFLYFTDHPDPELGKAVSEGRREEFAAFGWSPDDVPDPQAHATFLRSRLDWAEREQPGHAEILDWHRRLIALRRAEPDLADGRLERVDVGFDESAGWLWFSRGTIVVAFNVGAQAIELSLGEGELELASEPGVRLAPGSLSLPPDSVAVMRARRAELSRRRRSSARWGSARESQQPPARESPPSGAPGSATG
jgi:maltooligosyltrehalose trehalohydrolase